MMRDVGKHLEIQRKQIFDHNTVFDLHYVCANFDNQQHD